jgi:hypothetical protein
MNIADALLRAQLNPDAMTNVATVISAILMAVSNHGSAQALN